MTTRSIPILLQTHLDGYGTTLAFLLKIKARNGTIIAVTNHDRDIPFDDGGGEIIYSSTIGMDHSSLSASGHLDVDNTEATLLIVPSSGFTDQQINAGVLDFAKFNVYRINWADKTAGHYNLLSGTTGAVRSLDGLAGVVELRGLSQSLKQSFIELYSITCRAQFGSQDGQRFPCRFDAASLWDSDTVASVDAEEPDRIFTATTTPSATGPGGALPFVPGLVTFTSGDNAGLTTEIEEVLGDEIKLTYQTPYDIQATDGFDIRPDCGKRFDEDCIALYDNALNFRGEPRITAGDEASQVMPGATVAAWVTQPAPEPTPP
jgi:uncharacterized phage protein (TIGR02218 family)